MTDIHVYHSPDAPKCFEFIALRIAPDKHSPRDLALTPPLFHAADEATARELCVNWWRVEALHIAHERMRLDEELRRQTERRAYPRFDDTPILKD